MTFKYSGQMRWNDDTQLWNEILQKERVTNKIHKTYNQTQDFANTHASRFGEGRHHQVDGKREEVIKHIQKNDLSKTQSLGYYNTDYVKD
jgi:hypothetical protein|tara:strand:+ start:92 stop:361 length:270 start_codon:yes stop_codon:yes gene_type:complete